MDAASRRFRDSPSFSSTLLDEIYRSIDEQPTVCTESVRKTQSKIRGTKHRNGCFGDAHNDEPRACLMHRLENKVREKPVVGRRSAADLERSSMRYECACSSSSSCDSYCCGGLGTESVVYGGMIQPKPIVYERDKQRIVQGHEGKFVKTKSKALKIYSDLKQPISPGGRIATFLNSLFKRSSTSTTTVTGVGVRSHLDRKSKSANASTCSSTSRSCLSNTPSSGRNGGKRSVRFYPADGDCRPCGHKSLHEEGTKLTCITKETKLNLSEKNRHISEAARNFLNKKVERGFNSTRNNQYDDDDDGRSDSSSDLFELDHLKYREELPVYETTKLDTNRLFM